ncbi:uncharacterized protein LOC116621522 [Nematostella vectensis]|uniref:uncharacterized protein LOC116621522 n=1 Tax=Nematostella vectensis TaxID=45351 RepID=UPI00207770F3|nr:uncharacterized protein LOC116621522 [Nematostella vectensis]
MEKCAIAAFTLFLLACEANSERPSITTSTNLIQATWRNHLSPKEAKLQLRVKPTDGSKPEKACNTNDVTSSLVCKVEGLEKASLHTLHLAYMDNSGSGEITEILYAMTDGEAVCKDMHFEFFSIIALALAVGILGLALFLLVLCLICRKGKRGFTSITARTRRQLSASGEVATGTWYYEEPTSSSRATPVKPAPYKGKGPWEPPSYKGKIASVNEGIEIGELPVTRAVYNRGSETSDEIANAEMYQSAMYDADTNVSQAGFYEI